MLGWQGVRSDPMTAICLSTSKLDEDHRDLRRIGKDDNVVCWMVEGGCCPLPGGFRCATHCYFFSLKTDGRH
ncbi:unnamed protein product [Caenorhabditis nigoni]